MYGIEVQNNVTLLNIPVINFFIALNNINVKCIICTVLFISIIVEILINLL
jgi:hypothetical protein